MRITTSVEIDPVAWAELVTDDDEATFFHTTGWTTALSEGLGSWSPLYVAAWENDRLVAGVPLMVGRRGGFSMIRSMPFGTYGGVLLASGAPSGAIEAVLERLVTLGSSPSVASLVFVDLPGRFRGAADARGLPAVEEEAQIVRLDRPYDEIWSAFRPSARNKIRKAEKAGVTVRRGSTADDFGAYHDMLVECSRRWGTRVEFGCSFFTALGRLDANVVQLWIAEHEGRIIGGDLNFALHDVIVNWGNVSRDTARQLAPNNILHATGIERGVAEGAHLFDLGSSAGIAGVEAFKRAFGTEPVRYRRYHIDKAWYKAARRFAGRARREEIP